MLSERSEFILFSERSLVFSKSYAAAAFLPAGEAGLVTFSADGKSD